MKNKNFADYGQPVLVGFGPVPLNPLQIMVTLAYALVGKKQDGKQSCFNGNLRLDLSK